MNTGKAGSEYNKAKKRFESAIKRQRTKGGGANKLRRRKRRNSKRNTNKKRNTNRKKRTLKKSKKKSKK